MNIYIAVKTSLEIKIILKKTTGLDHESFLDLLEFVEHGEDCKNIKFYESSKRLYVSFIVKLSGFITIRKKA